MKNPDTDECPDPNCVDGMTWITAMDGKPEKMACGCVPLASESKRNAGETADEKRGRSAYNVPVHPVGREGQPDTPPTL